MQFRENLATRKFYCLRYLHSHLLTESHRSSEMYSKLICFIIKARILSLSHRCQDSTSVWVRNTPWWTYAIRLRWIRRQSDEIPRKWTEKGCRSTSEREASKPANDLCWSNVEESWIGDAVSSRESNQLPIDQYWHKIGLMTNDDGSTGTNYPQLLALVKCCLSHGNAAPERGFSINTRSGEGGRIPLPPKVFIR